MMEHLLNNAAQALVGVGAAKAGEEQMIRVSVSVSGSAVSGSEVSGSADGERVHLVVSDTGPGFAQPGRVLSLAVQWGWG
jgi:signal transduction histidine kinase